MADAPCIQHLKDYVAIPSVNPMGRSDMPDSIAGERRLAEHLSQKFKAMGLDAQIFGNPERPSVMARATASGSAAASAETILIASHIDTVPIDNMEIEPFDPVIRDDRLYGRGSCDTKAGMAAVVAALERVLRNGTLRNNVILVGESDEELGSIGARDLISELGDEHVDWVLATEPTGMRLITRHKGIAILKLVATGSAGHSSAPELGRNAIYSLGRAIGALEGLNATLATRSDPQLGSATLSVGVIGGGAAPNIIPDAAWLLSDRRLLPGETAESVRAEIEQALREGGIDDVRVENCSVEKDALGTPDDHISVHRCRPALAARGLPTETGSVAFGTDAGVLEQVGLRGLVFGPGSIDRAHTAREYVEVDQVETAAEIYVDLFEAIR